MAKQGEHIDQKVLSSLFLGGQTWCVESDYVVPEERRKETLAKTIATKLSALGNAWHKLTRAA